MPRLIQVIESEVRRGDGKDDPYRNVTQYHTPDGEFLAEMDDYENKRFWDRISELKEVIGEAIVELKNNRIEKALEILRECKKEWEWKSRE